jgi:hypothetical protein
LDLNNETENTNENTNQTSPAPPLISDEERKKQLLRSMPTPKIPPFVKSDPPCEFHDDPSTWIEWLETEVMKFKKIQESKKEKGMIRNLSVALIGVVSQVSAVTLDTDGKQLAQDCTDGSCDSPATPWTVGTYYGVTSAIPAGSSVELFCSPGNECAWRVATCCVSAESALATGDTAAVMADGKLHKCTTDGGCSGGTCEADTCDADTCDADTCGYTEVQNPDGSKTLTYTNGDVKTVRADGTSSLVRPDGSTREEANG